MSVLDIATCSIVENLKGSLRQPSDLVAYLLLQIAALYTIWHGETVLMPAVLSECSMPVRILNHAIGIWMYLGIVVNLYMIRNRHSSIRNRVLTPPDWTGVPQPGQPGYANYDNEVMGDVGMHRRNPDFKDELKHIAEQFTIRPYDSSDNWHICASCETFVPPRSWHCFICQSCILRRDHHCIFAGSCIGEDNHSNFLGLLVYLAAGTFYSTILTFIDVVIIQNVVWWAWLAKSLLAVYTIFFDFSVYYLIATLNFTGCMAATGTCIYYFLLAFKGQTSADSCRKISRKLIGKSEYSYRNFRDFLGPYPLYRVLWPFHKIRYNTYDNQESEHLVKNHLPGRCLPPVSRVLRYLTNTQVSVYSNAELKVTFS